LEIDLIFYSCDARLLKPKQEALNLAMHDVDHASCAASRHHSLNH